VSIDAWKDYNTRLANEFKSYKKVWIGLMNEPYGMQTDLWINVANEGLSALRSAGFQGRILVPGNRWTGGKTWYVEDGYAISFLLTSLHAYFSKKWGI
jgi:hypothetical protein